MRQRIIATAGVALILATTYTVAGAADQCPELSQAKAALNSGEASKESRAACDKGDRALSARKANEALKLLKP